MTIQRILVPVDFSAASISGATTAAALAVQLGARLRLVTVLDVSDLRVAMKAHLRGFGTNEEVKRQVHQWIRDSFAAIPMPKGLRPTHGVRRGIVEKELIAAVAAYRPQLIVMGSVGMTHALPIGSKTEYVIRNCRVPVMVVTA